ncbi:hypothetical protein XENORESO_020584 [Xenotaenia resolanae]|uniref:Uncharacterized protein n=1 Tax=Xenotaenia resolanae TaxID=208358 RepID=A0ABV0W3X2_9TELE
MKVQFVELNLMPRVKTCCIVFVTVGYVYTCVCTRSVSHHCKHDEMWKGSMDLNSFLRCCKCLTGFRLQTHLKINCSEKTTVVKSIISTLMSSLTFFIVENSRVITILDTLQSIRD